MKSNKITIIILLIILTILTILSICLGSVKISISELFKIIIGKSNNQASTYIIKKMRIPRIIGAIIVGACLASSGLIFQSVFKNPMADSYMLGISSSASFSVCLGMLIFKNITSSLSFSAYAFIGSIVCSIFLFTSSKKNTMKLLLTGVALNFFFASATTLLIYLNRKQLDSILFWTMGSLASLNWNKIIILTTISIITLIIEYKERYTLDLFLLDDQTARSSGINIENKKITLLIVASIATSIAVAFCGVIGFVGMLSSHIIRLILGPNHKRIIIPTILFGSCIVVISDLIARTVLSPTELPIGVISSVLGAPLLYVLIKRKKSWIN